MNAQETKNTLASDPYRSAAAVKVIKVKTKFQPTESKRVMGSDAFSYYSNKFNLEKARQFKQDDVDVIQTSGITSQGQGPATKRSYMSFQVIESVSYLLGLIDAREWDTFRSCILEPSPAHFRARTDIIAQIPEFNGMTLLHAAVKCDPPLELVRDMIRICPELTAHRDCLGRTPLHVAAGSGAAPSLVKILVCALPAACDVQDVDGKTPLHFACDSSCVLFASDIFTKKESSTPKTAPCHDVIFALLSGSLAAATVEDTDEMNPVEYAIISNASLRTIKMLQAAARKHLRASSVSTKMS